MQKSFKRKFLHLVLLSALALMPGVSKSQVNGFVCDFENDVDTAAWDYVSDTTRLKWNVGNATSRDEGRSIYISADNGATNTYYGGSKYVFAYRTVHMDAGAYEFSYDWKANGEGNYDFMRVALAPASAVIVGGESNGVTRNGLPTGWIALDGGSKLNQSTEWTTQTGEVTITTAGDYKFVLYWHNDVSVVNNPPAAVDNISLVIPSCRQPKNMVASAITNEGAMISWTGTATEWEVEYMLKGGVLGSGSNTVETVTENSIVLSGLLANRDYEVYVKGFCGEEYSRYAKLEFRTACGDMVLPLVESFETETVQEIPACWSVHGGSANVDENYSINVITPFGSKFVHLYGACVLATPHIGVAGNTLAMDIYVSKDEAEAGKLAVGFVANLSDIADAEFVDTIDAQIDSMSLYEIDFSSLGIAEGGYIVLKQFDNRFFMESSGYDIDNIYIRQLSDCPRPADLTVSEVGARSAKLEWTSVWESSTYEVMYGTTNDPTSSMNTIMTGILDDTLMLDQLQPETEYYVWVRSNCGENYSEWRAGSSFTTQIACAMVQDVRVTSLSYLGFAMTWDYNDAIGETATQTEVGWKNIAENTYHVQVVDQNYYIFQGLEAGTRYDVRLRTICGSDTAEVYTETVATSLYGFQVGTGETIHDCMPVDCFERNNYSQMLYPANDLNGLDVISGIAFNVDCDQNGYDRTWDVYMGHTNRTSLNSYDYMPVDSMTLVADSVAFAIRYGWSGITLDAPFNYDGSSNLVIAINDHSNHKERGVYFKAHDGLTLIASNSNAPYDPASPSGMYAYNYIPDILFLQPLDDDGCDAPLAVVGSVTESSVEVVWNNNPNATTYQLEYRTMGATDWIVAANSIADSSYIVDNLASGSYYNFRVGMVCNNHTIYSNELEALTLCGMASVPYSENFDGSEMNPCWIYGNKTVANNLPYVQYHSLYMNYEPGGYAILPQMAEELSLLHLTFSTKSRTPGARIMVAVGTDASNINGFEIIDTFATASTDVFTPHECSLANYWGEGRYIAFITIDKYIYLEDVVVDFLPECGYPTEVSVSNIGTTTATLNWNNEASGTLQWMIVYGEEGTSVRDTAYALPTENSYDFVNLLPNKSYSVMLYNLCGTDTMGILMPVLFRTECGVLTLPYYEDFNGMMVNNYHPCWFTTEFHAYGTWSQDTVPNVKYHDSLHDKVVTFGDNVDIISPRIEAPINTIVLNFDAKIDNRIYGGDLAIGFTTSTTDISGAIYVDTIEFADTEWEHYEVSFANINVTGQGYIVFKNFGNTEYTDWEDPWASMYYNGYIDNVMITVDNHCDKVTDVAVGNVTANTAVITFNDASATGDYTIGYAIENDITNITETQDFTTTTATLTGLTAGAHYFVWVRKNCGYDTSLWTEGPTFTTPCDAISEMPYYENFDSYTSSDIQNSISIPTTYPNHTMPSCWTFLNMSQSKQYYPQVYLCKPNSFIGYSDSAVCMMFITGANTPVYAVMPEFSAHVSTMELSFKYRNEGTSESNGILTLGVLTDATDTSTFIALQSYPIVSQITEVSHNFRLDPLDLNADYRIAFRYVGPRDRFRLTMDNVELVASSDCITPEGLTVGAVTSESIAISWSGISSNYNVQYRKTDETVWTNAPTISGTHAVISNLIPQTEYALRVQSNCGENVSEWSNEVIATTGCGAQSLPYVEDFNSYEAGRGTSTDTYPPLNFNDPTLPNCWYFPQMAIPTPIAFLTSASEYASSGMCLFMLSDSLIGMYAALPEMDAPVNQLTLNFTYRNEGLSANMPPLEVGVMTNPADISTFQTLEIMPRTATKTSVSHVFDMDGQLNDNTTYYIAFKYGGTAAHGSQYYLSIDDIMVDYSASCHKPSQFRVDNVTASSASVHWLGDAGNYEVNYRQTTEQSWTTLNTTQMNIDLDNLQGNTQYAVRVRALCGGDDNSEWTTEALFTTECASMDLPYLETFTDFVLYDFSKYCWNRYYGTLDSVLANTLELLPATGGWGFSDLHPIGNDGTNMWIDIWGTRICEWSVSPQINLTSATQVEFDMARFDYANNDVWQADDKFVVLATTDDGNTWHPLQEWNGTEFPNIPIHTASAMHVTIDLSQFDNEAIRLAFYAESTVAGGDHLIIIDNLEVTGSDTPNVNCDMPTDLNATDITDVSASLSWQGNANNYQLQYRRMGSSNWILATVNGLNYSVDNLTSGTDYEWRVRAVCSESEYSWWSSVSQFTTLGDAPICNPVDYVSVSSIDTNSALVTWFAGGDEMQWEVEYGEANFSLGQGTSVIVNVEEYELENLNKATIYDVYVRAICDDNFYSEWSERVQFSTLSGETPQGIDGIDGDYELNIYPNPTHSATTISLNGIEGKITISILDINGRQIASEILECNADCEKRLDVTNLAQGTYFVRVLGSNINSVRKLIVR